MSEELNEPADDQVQDVNPASVDDDGTIKLDLGALNNSPKEEESETPPATPPADVSEPDAPEHDVPEVAPADDDEGNEPLLEIIEDEDEDETPPALTQQSQDNLDQAQADAAASGIEMPENIQKLVEFMNETGGSLEDYVKLNTDFDSLDQSQLLREYYKSTHTHLDEEDIEFMMSDKFSYDEDLDEETDIRRKKLARKEALAKAKKHFDGLKTNYYAELKGGSKLSPEQKEAVDFFNRYKKESEEASTLAERQARRFKQASDTVFSENFQGFDYNVGDKKYRFKVKNPSEIKEVQGDINNFVKKFLNENNEMADAKGYHKSLFTAMNADQIAQHFYEQGKADAVKDSMKRTKNVDMGARGVHTENVKTSNGWTMRAVGEGESASKLKVKFRK